MGLTYDPIVELYNSAGALQNEASYTPFNKSILYTLRADIDLMGGLIGMTSGNGSWNGDGTKIWTKGTTASIDDGVLWLSYITDMRTACEEMATELTIDAPAWTIATVNLKGLYDNTGAIIPAQETTHTDFRKTSLWTDVQTALIAIEQGTFDFAEIWIDSIDGSDGNTGTEISPWATWNHAMVTDIDGESFNINEAGSGILHINAGTYEMDTALTADNITILGEAAYNTFCWTAHLVTSAAMTGNNLTVKDIFFDQTIGGAAFGYFETTNNLNVQRCVFRATSGRNVHVNGSTYASFSHCSFYNSGKNGFGLYATGTTLCEVTDCLFYDMSTCITVSGTVNYDYCGFYDFDNETWTSGTYNGTNQVYTDPQIRAKSNAFLDISSPYIDASSTGADIGAYPDGPYNTYKVLSDSITASDITIDKLTESVSDSITVVEDVTTSVFNVNIDMFLGGLFDSAVESISYLSADSIRLPGLGTPYTYNGAALDISFDNNDSDLCELYLVAGDGVTDYTPVAWWAANASYSADSTTDAYFINGWRDCITNDEIGKAYDEFLIWDDKVGGVGSGIANYAAKLPNASENPDNSSVAQLIVHARIYNTVTETWSEMVTDTKLYGFNDFNKVMYYMGDNPRSVIDEYANHANYQSQKFHSGTGIYTNAAGVDWIDDDRHYIYNTPAKADLYAYYHDVHGTDPIVFYSSYVKIHWQKKLITSAINYIEEKRSRHQFTIYACIYVNHGNMNFNSLSCFTTSSTRVHTIGTALSPTSYPAIYPVDNASNTLQYVELIGIQGSDCTVHSSHAAAFYVTPDTNANHQVRMSSDHAGNDLFPYTNLKFQTINPWSCPWGLKDLFTTFETQGVTPGGWSPWTFFQTDYGVNTNNNTGVNEEGRLGSRASFTSVGWSTPSWNW